MSLLTGHLRDGNRSTEAGSVRSGQARMDMLESALAGILARTRKAE
jgi:hypothetical protein